MRRLSLTAAGWDAGRPAWPLLAAKGTFDGQEAWMSVTEPSGGNKCAWESPHLANISCFYISAFPRLHSLQK